MSEITVRFLDFPDVPLLSNTHTGEGHWLVDIPGWWGTPDVRDENDPRPDSDGDFDHDEVYSGARFPVVVGRVRFDDEAALFAARDPIARMMAYRGPHTIEVASLDGVRTATVVRNAGLVWDLSKAPYYVDFELPFKAADPRKYWPERTAQTGLPVAGGGVLSPVTSPFSQVGGGSPGRLTLTNAGTADTDPTFTVAGGAISGGVELTRIETGERLRLEWPLLATDVVVFDSGTGQVWLNDQAAISGYLTKAQWWSLGPGETATVQFAALGDVTGTPVLTATWRDADA